MIRQTPLFPGTEPPVDRPGATAPGTENHTDHQTPTYQPADDAAYWDQRHAAPAFRAYDAALLLAYFDASRRRSAVPVDYDGFASELVETCQREPHRLAVLGVPELSMLVAVWRRVECSLDDQDEAAAADRAARERGERDEWRVYLSIDAKHRDLLAEHRVPFRVLAAREREVETFRPVYRKRAVWQLLIEQAPFGVKGVVNVPRGNEQRDRQCAWLVEKAPLEVPLRFFHRETAQGHRLLCMERTAPWTGPKDWEHLPPSVRKRLT